MSDTLILEVIFSGLYCELLDCLKTNFSPFLDCLTNPMLMIAFYLVRPESQWEPCNEVEFQIPIKRISGIRTRNLPIWGWRAIPLCLSPLNEGYSVVTNDNNDKS